MKVYECDRCAQALLRLTECEMWLGRCTAKEEEK